MNVQELIDALSEIDDKTLDVVTAYYDDGSEQYMDADVVRTDGSVTTNGQPLVVIA